MCFKAFDQCVSCAVVALCDILTLGQYDKSDGTDDHKEDINHCLASCRCHFYSDWLPFLTFQFRQHPSGQEVNLFP